MATAIASLVLDEPVASDVGMTGEITLTGQVLPIGGIREKTLAAERAGLKRVIVPRENEPDLEDLPPETRKELEFTLVDTVEEVFKAAFDGKRVTRRAGAPSLVRQAAEKLACERRRALGSALARAGTLLTTANGHGKEGSKWRTPRTNSQALRAPLGRTLNAPSQTRSSARTSRRLFRPPARSTTS